MDKDLSRWLRSVRPRTAADDNWTQSREADEVLAAVHRRTASPGQQQRRVHRIWMPVAAVAAAVVVVVLASTTTAGERRVPRGAAQQLPPTRPVAKLLSAYTSCDNLLDGLRSHASDHVGRYGFPWSRYPYAYYDETTPIPMAANAGFAPGKSAPQMSTTNVQEVGVDEPDIVKTDGGHIITLTDGVLRIVDVFGRDVVGTLDLTAYAGWQDAQLLVHDDNAIVIMGNESAIRGGGPMIDYVRPIGPGYSVRSTVLFVDLHGQPAVTGSIRISGAYLDARQIGTTVRLVAASAPRIAFPDRRIPVEQNRDLVEQAPLSSWLPSYTISTAGHSTTASVPCEQISHPKSYTGTSMLTVYTLDLDHLGADPEPVSIAADGDTVYATSDSLYVASNPDWFCCQSRDQRTELHRFDISGTGRPVYLGSGSIPGRLLSQYSLSEYDGSLRVATTSGGWHASSSSVYVLDAARLEITGQVGHLGDGEQIYAVRFAGPMAYVVTFHQTDPLYLVDLHDPSKPTVAGTLQLNGFSDYLHDAGDGRLIGVGQDATSSGRMKGLQVSLFDVSDPSTPFRTGHVVLSKAIGESGFDPHTFLYWAPSGLVVVPTQTWNRHQAGKVLVCTVAGRSLSEVGTLANPADPNTTDDGRGIQRSMVVGDELWTISSSGVQAVDPATLDRASWIPFPSP